MDNLSIGLFILIGVLVIQSFFNSRTTCKLVSQLAEVNKQLLIVVTGKDGKPEALRALVASAKPPQGKLQGIAVGKKKDKKPANKDYTLEIGVH